MTLVIRAKVDTDRAGPDGGPSIRYTAIRAATHSFMDANQSLLNLLKAYGEEPNMAQQEEEVNFF